jgi:hypothetical protein
VAVVPLTVVADEIEAETVCGLLRSNGIRCSYRSSGSSAGLGALGGGFAIAGRLEVLVEDVDVEAARELLEHGAGDETA